MIEDEQQDKKAQIDHPPKETLYIRNINQKIKPKDVKYALYNLFQSFGQILQIIVKRNDKMRGQAFVVFREVGQATAAKNNLNGYPIFGKPMVDIDLTVEDIFFVEKEQNCNFWGKMIVDIRKIRFKLLLINQIIKQPLPLFLLFKSINQSYGYIIFDKHINSNVMYICFE